MQFLLLLVGIYFGICAAIAWNTVRPKRNRHETTPLVYDLSYESVRFRSRDGVELSGWMISTDDMYRPHGRKPPRGIVVLCHGVDSTRNAMLPVARMLHKNGFATLLFDFRARGESGGNRCTIGFREVDDLLAALDLVRNRSDLSDLPVGVLGESMGGAVAIMGAARNPEVAGVVAESPFAVLTHALDNHFRSAFGPAGPILGAPARWIGERLIGCPCDNVVPLREIPQISPRPILLIQDSDDQLCPPTETEALMNAAQIPKELWTVPDSGHIGARLAQPEEYEKRVVEFFTRAFDPAVAPGI